MHFGYSTKTEPKWTIQRDGCVDKGKEMFGWKEVCVVWWMEF